ncbi:bifunctional diguanylate cyclase/phosphodiesterase [Microvirga solisilvae]|uniref:bifunctional diguanylate cyclase/phosphodiesterase n=1 Tax=Microvirga solisilvae TaxID=2919498 RepID=UPI001FAFE1E8|nr:EAL domain-containing protein [Microvirga solisilvae]
MNDPNPSWQEADRLVALRSFPILDTAPESFFDAIASMAAHMCKAPIGLISFIDEDRQWLKAAHGIQTCEIPRTLSICTHTIGDNKLLVIPDLKKHKRFKDHPLVNADQPISFYAGIPLTTKDGLPLGTLCVLDYKARRRGLSEEQALALTGLAQAVLSQLQLRLSEKTLAESHRLKQRLLSSSGDCIAVLDLELRLLYMNENGLKSIGFENIGSVQGQCWTDLFAIAERSSALQAIEAAKTDGIGRYAGSCPTATGISKWWDIVITPIMNDDGVPQSLLCVSRDITDIHKAQENLRQSESRFRTLVDVMPLSFLSPQAVWFSDRKGTFSYCNEYWYDYTGLERDERSSRRWESIVHPIRRDQSLVLLDDAFSRESSFEVEIPIRRACDDSYRWFIVRGQPLKDENGDIEQWFGIAMDIHERKQSEDALRNSEERLQLALRAAHMVAWEYNPRTKETKRSENSLSLLGINPGTEVELFENVHPLDEPKVKHFLERIEIYGADSVECRILLPNGQLRWFRVRAEKAGPDRIVGVTFDITDQKDAEEEIWHSANHDPLTGLPNRSLFQRRLDAALANAKQNGTSVSLLLVDLDEFKDINDTLGHDAGDALLKETASRLSSMVRDCDTVARLGGDEFAILVVEPLKLENSTRLGSLILETLRQPFTYQKRTLVSRVSIGVAAYPDHDDEPAELMKDADIALYQAKAQGRHQVVTYSSTMRHLTEQRVSLGRSLRDAIFNHEIVPFYQPKISLDTGQVVGFEALARWHHPRRGILTPATFGAAFEDYELASEIGKLLMSRVATDLRQWLDDDLPIGRVALNLSPAEFIQPGMVDNMLRTLDWIKVSPKFLEVEVTETVLLGRNSDNVSKLLEQFRQHDIHIALDDFGTGYASLTHLKQFPVNHIKIDRSFVQNLENDPDDEAIIAAVIGLGKSLKLQVTAEGVETLGQAERLRKLGCDHVQGFFYARPIPACDIPHFLAKWRRKAERRPTKTGPLQRAC